MPVPIKITWAISALRNQINELCRRGSDGLPSYERYKMAWKALEDVERHALLYMDGVMPPNRNGEQYQFVVTFKNGDKKRLFRKDHMRRVLQDHMAGGYNSEIVGIKMSRVNFEHCDISVMIDYVNSDAADHNKV